MGGSTKITVPSISICGRGSERNGRDGQQVAQGRGQPLLGTCNLKERKLQSIRRYHNEGLPVLVGCIFTLAAPGASPL